MWPRYGDPPWPGANLLSAFLKSLGKWSREAAMRKYSIVVVLAVLLGSLCVVPLHAQGAFGSVKGVCKDATGAPIAGAVVEWHNVDNGRKYTLKTNAKGEYFSLGIEPGKYDVTLTKDGKQLDQLNKYQVTLDEMVLDFDLKKSEEESAKQHGMTPEQLKAIQEAQAKHDKDVGVVKALNEKLAAAKTASDAGDFDTAIAQLSSATEMDPTRDLLWFKLGDAYKSSGLKQTDAEEKKKRLTEAATDYQKAVDLKQKAVDADPKKSADDTKNLAAYYNNLADADAKSGKPDDATKAYEQAAQLNPAGAAQYYYNMGAVYTNAGRLDEAITAFDKSIAADPTKADAYYQKGVNLIGKAKTDPSGKVIAVPGTSEALNKYLELQPTGQFAEGAKGMLEYIGSKIETSYGKTKTTKK
jgi:tetratricopeptide (TPR) repeat protein